MCALQRAQITIFPSNSFHFFPSLKGLISVRAHNLRDWTHDVHQSVDDTPVGGGAGMVMKPAVWAECLDELLGIHTESPDRPILIFPNPSAPLFTQQDATELSHAQHLVFGCGRYEGYDARIPVYYRERGVDVREYSIGDYVLNGGEVAVSVMLEAITRLLPGFMGNPDSIVEESYTGGNALLEHNQYTKPATWRGLDVPAVLLSGDHAKVDRFRRDEALEKTNRIRLIVPARSARIPASGTCRRPSRRSHGGRP